MKMAVKMHENGLEEHSASKGRGNMHCQMRNGGRDRTGLAFHQLVRDEVTRCVRAHDASSRPFSCILTPRRFLQAIFMHFDAAALPRDHFHAF